MNCRRIRELLPLYADGDPEDPDLGVVSGHLESCEECRARLAVDRELAAALAEMSAAPQAAAIAPAVRRGVMARVEKERRWGPLRRRAESLGNATVWLAVSAVTALLLVALAITWRSMIARRARQDAAPAGPYAQLGWEIVGDEVIAAPYYWVIDGERVDRTPQLSPDGTKVAYLPTVDGKATDLDRLIVRDLRTGQDLDLTPEEGYSYTSVRWSPDSRSLAFVRYRYAEGQATPTEVWRIDADGRNLKLLYRPPGTPDARGPAFVVARWSADGRYLELKPTIWSPGGPPTWVRADGGGEVPEVLDGYALQVVRTDELPDKPEDAPQGGQSLVLYDPQTKRTTVLGAFAGTVSVSESSVSPDGEWICFRVATPEAGISWTPATVWVVRRDGSGLRQVMHGDHPLDAGDGPFWADGGRAYFEQPAYVSAIWLAEMDAASGTAGLITTPWHIVDIASVSRDGRRLLAIKGGPQQHELHLLGLAPADGPVPVVETVAGLVVEEHAVASQEAGFPTDVEGTGWLGAEILDRRRPWREPDPAAQVAASNEALRPFGYRLELDEMPGREGHFCALYRGDEVLFGDILHAWPVAVSSEGGDFALLLEPARGRPVLVRPSGTQEWELGLHAYQAPAFAGQDLVSVENDEQHRQYAVRRGDEIVHTFAPPADVVTEPTRGLWSWEGHWVLEVNGQVLVDGGDLNQALGYDEIFGWRLLQGRPFYFFRQGESVGVSYDGQVLPQQYEQVPHYQCCSGAAYNAQGNDTMVWFFGLRGGTWYYVEMGIYGPGPDGPAATATPALAAPTQAAEATGWEAWAKLQESEASGALRGELTLVNAGLEARVLQGRPQVTLLDGQGQIVPTIQGELENPAGENPVVVLQPGQRAVAEVYWANYCGEAPVAPLSLRVLLPGPGAEELAALLVAQSPTPRCNVEAPASVLSVGPFAAGEDSPLPTETPAPAPQLGRVLSLDSIKMVDAANGWATSQGVVLRTNDGGATWRNVTPHAVGEGASRLDLAGSEFPDGERAWVAGGGDPSGWLTIWSTTSGGQTWQRSSLPVSGGAAQFSFIDSRHGWTLVHQGVAAGSEAVTVLGTEDGGASWMQLSAADPQNPTPGSLPFGGNKSGLSFSDESTGWLTLFVPVEGKVFLCASHDGGRTWQEQALALPEGYEQAQASPQPPAFFTDEEGVLAVDLWRHSSAVVFYVTHDGGATWSAATPVSAAVGGGVTYDFVSADDGWVLVTPALGTADGAELRHTQDGGRTWTAVRPNLPLEAVTALDFAGDQAGWALCSAKEGSYLLSTADGGRMWERLEPRLGTPLPGATLTYPDTEIGYAIDYPANWHIQAEPGWNVILTSWDPDTVPAVGGVAPDQAKIDILPTKPYMEQSLDAMVAQVEAGASRVLHKEQWDLAGVPAVRLQIVGEDGEERALLLTVINGRSLRLAGYGDLTAFDPVAQTLRPLH